MHMSSQCLPSADVTIINRPIHDTRLDIDIATPQQSRDVAVSLRQNNLPVISIILH